MSHLTVSRIIVKNCSALSELRNDIHSWLILALSSPLPLPAPDSELDPKFELESEPEPLDSEEELELERELELESEELELQLELELELESEPGPVPDSEPAPDSDPEPESDPGPPEVGPAPAGPSPPAGGVGCGVAPPLAECSGPPGLGPAREEDATRVPEVRLKEGREDGISDVLLIGVGRIKGVLVDGEGVTDPTAGEEFPGAGTVAEAAGVEVAVAVAGTEAAVVVVVVAPPADAVYNAGPGITYVLRAFHMSTRMPGSVSL
jgi:hypothetical protein